MRKSNVLVGVITASALVVSSPNVHANPFTFTFPGSACQVKNPGAAHYKNNYFRNDATTMVEVICPLPGADYASQTYITVKSNGSATALRCRWEDNYGNSGLETDYFTSGSWVTGTSSQSKLNLGYVQASRPEPVIHCEMPGVNGTSKSFIYQYEGVSPN